MLLSLSSWTAVWASIKARVKSAFELEVERGLLPLLVLLLCTLERLLRVPCRKFESRDSARCCVPAAKDMGNELGTGQ